MATGNKKRKLSLTSPGLSEESAPKLTNNDFNCPICFDVLDEVYSTLCGHSFCYKCISKSLKQTSQCPMCKVPLPLQNPILPNFSLNDIVTKYKNRASAEREAMKGIVAPEFQQLVKAAPLMSSEERRKVVAIFTEAEDFKQKGEEYLRAAVSKFVLEEMKKRKLMELEKVKECLATIEKDLQELSDITPPSCDCVVPSGSPSSPSPSPSPSATSSSSLPSRPPPPSPSAPPSCPHWATEAPFHNRTLKAGAHIQEVIDSYYFMRNDPQDSGEDGLQGFMDGVHRFTCYSSFRELSSLVYGDQTSNSCIVSSIEFDKDNAFVAVAGVAKKIKVFNYSTVINSTGFTNHFPVQEMVCTAKLSSLSYNPYFKSTLASSDYEGCVCVWDTHTGTKVSRLQEHEKRVWSVVYSPSDPNLFASGSDDCSVKLWRPTQSHSCFSFPTPGNVCTVKFHPSNHYFLAYGSADHVVHYVDLRNTKESLASLRGHKKAVSYVQFISPTELVSASTDSELRLWDLNSKFCTRVYRGHVNERNFVGLSVTPHYISCGSENNSFYVYNKHISKPMLKYTFNLRSLLEPTSTENGEDHTNFVSSVCWKKNSNIILAANSQGLMKVLQMC